MAHIYTSYLILVVAKFIVKVELKFQQIWMEGVVHVRETLVLKCECITNAQITDQIKHRWSCFQTSTQELKQH